MKFKTLFIVALMATLWSTDSLSQECEPVTFDGYTYDVVQIGNQCWFAENLRTRHYANGDEIPGGLSNREWKLTDSGARAVYGEGEVSREELLENLKMYGGLYNWLAVDDGRGLCPANWHVPTDDEWITLEMELGMRKYETDDFRYEGDEGRQMKTTYGWEYENYEGNLTNSSGFSGLPGGIRGTNGGFYNAGTNGYWWSSSPSCSGAWNRGIQGRNLYRYDSNQRDGFSVRCLRDADEAKDPKLDQAAAKAQGCKPVTFDGYTYDVVQIGDQCWFAENLRTEHYANGDEIQVGLSNREWELTDSGARAVYGEGEVSREELLENLKTYGALYNWYAVDDGRGLCPANWHVPTGGEWTTMIDFLGGYEDAGVKMKTICGWDDDGYATNSSGFSGLPGGYRHTDQSVRFRLTDGKFYDAGHDGTWWSSSPDGSTASVRGLNADNPDVYHFTNNQRDGFSVRCLKDAE